MVHTHSRPAGPHGHAGLAWVAVTAVAGVVLGCAPDSSGPGGTPARDRARAVGPAATQPGAPTTQPKPMRIASVMLATDEILFDLVGLDRLAAVTVYADKEGYSNLVGRLPKHVPRVRGEIESILSVRPDLVCVSQFNRADFIELIKRAGLPCFRNEQFHTIAEIRTGIRRLGQVVGEPERARRMVQQMDTCLEGVRKRLVGVTARPRVLHWSGGWTSGTRTTVHDMIEAAGGRNAAAEIGLEGPTQIATEQVLKLDPDYVLVCEGPNAMAFAAIEEHPVLRRIGAVRHQRVIRMPGRYLLTVSHHLVKGVAFLARRLHPKRFPHAPAQEAHDP